MKKGTALVCAILCALTLLLVGCSTRVSGDAEGAKANGAEGEHAKELEDALVKHWNLRHIKMDGLDIWKEDNVDLSLFVEKDGSATMSMMNGNATFFRWKATSVEDITFYREYNDTEYRGGKKRAVKEYTPFSATYHIGENELWVDGGVLDGTGATLCFGDGIQLMSQCAPQINSDNITDIKDASAIEGDWKLVYVNNGATVVEGEPDAIASYYRYSDGYLSLSAGGIGTFLGDEATWAVGDGIGSITVPKYQQTLDVEQLSDGIVVTSEKATYKFVRANE